MNLLCVAQLELGYQILDTFSIRIWAKISCAPLDMRLSSDEHLSRKNLIFDEAQRVFCADYPF